MKYDKFTITRLHKKSKKRYKKIQKDTKNSIIYQNFLKSYIIICNKMVFFIVNIYERRKNGRNL